MNIREALGQLDSIDDDQWTGEGLPKVDVVSSILGRTTTRKEITDAAPHFTRTNAEGLDADGTTTEVVKENASGVAVPNTGVVAGVPADGVQPIDVAGDRTDLVENQKLDTTTLDANGNRTDLVDSKETSSIAQDANGNPIDLIEGDLVQGDDGVITDDVNNKTDQQAEISHPDHGDVRSKDDPELTGTFDDFLSGPPMETNEFVKFLTGVDIDDLGELKTGLDEQLADIQKAKNELSEYENRVRQALMYTKTRIARDVPDMSDAEANRAFLNSQHEARLARQQRSNELLKGINKNDLDPRAPIDKSMALNRSRGSKRPNYFTKG